VARPLLFPVVQDQTGLSNFQRLAIVVGAIVVLVVAYLAFSGGGDDAKKTASQPAATGSSSTQSTATSGTDSSATDTSGTTSAASPPTVRVVGAKPQGGVKKLNFTKGDPIRFRVVSDTADEIHVHGYDLMEDVPKGGSVTFSFKGSIDGRFVVELENHGEQIAELDIQP
jgi:New glue family protein